MEEPRALPFKAGHSEQRGRPLAEQPLKAGLSAEAAGGGCRSRGGPRLRRRSRRPTRGRASIGRPSPGRVACRSRFGRTRRAPRHRRWPAARVCRGPPAVASAAAAAGWTFVLGRKHVPSGVLLGLGGGHCVGWGRRTGQCDPSDRLRNA